MRKQTGDGKGHFPPYDKGAEKTMEANKIQGEARVRGKRDGDSIAGTIDLPMGTLEFAGTRD